MILGMRYAVDTRTGHIASVEGMQVATVKLSSMGHFIDLELGWCWDHPDLNERLVYIDARDVPKAIKRRHLKAHGIGN